jgi:decaprenylphospho-beta-D-erythro-pentofuranosid-2-ulose 2-reductase
MNNAINQPQTILVLGGGSEIGQAIVHQLESPALRTVILAGRTPGTRMATPLDGDPKVVSETFDALDHAGHDEFVQEMAAEHGDLDIVIQAFGQLGDDTVNVDPVAAASLAEVNYVGALTSGLAVAAQLRRQGHGILIVLSSVAGVRTRASNFVYGSTKAAQDAFATGLGHSLQGSGAKVVVVRPGYVRTKMSAGVEEAPFACDPDDVATAVVKGLRRGGSVIWAPALLQGLFGALRYAPGPIWRKLDR